MSAGFAEEPATFDHGATRLASVGHLSLKIDSAGRIVIPAEMRAAMMIMPGDTVSATVEDGELRIVSPAVALKRVKAHARRWKEQNPAVSVVDELISERREEALQELQEANAWRRARGLAPLI